MKRLFTKTATLLVLSFFLHSALFPADSTLTKKLFPGVIFKEAFLEGPIALQELVLDLDSVEVRSALAHSALGNGGEKTSEIFERLKKQNPKVFAAINADFFGGKPKRILNSMVKNGEIVKAVNIEKSQFAVTAGGEPVIKILRFFGSLKKKNFEIEIKSVNELSKVAALLSFYFNPILKKLDTLKGVLFDVQKPLTTGEKIPFVCREISVPLQDTLTRTQVFLQLSDSLLKVFRKNVQVEDTLFFFATFDSTKEKITTLVGGRPILVKKGKAIQNFFGVEGLHSAWFIGKNPRTAIGFDKSKKRLFVVTVDGRQPGYSMGMTLPELAEYLKNEGAFFALNLDGGGSTTMVINGTIVNFPSDSTGERPVHNAVVFLRK